MIPVNIKVNCNFKPCILINSLVMSVTLMNGLILPVPNSDVQSGPVIPRFVKLRIRLSCGSMMDPRLLDSNILGLQSAISCCKQRCEDELAPNSQCTLKTRWL